MKCGKGIPAPARVSYIRRVWLATKSLLPPEMAKNVPSETRASRIENCSHERFPNSADRNQFIRLHGIGLSASYPTRGAVDDHSPHGHVFTSLVHK